jgi:hypothetical protein
VKLACTDRDEFLERREVKKDLETRYFHGVRVRKLPTGISEEPLFFELGEFSEHGVLRACHRRVKKPGAAARIFRTACGVCPRTPSRAASLQPPPTFRKHSSPR